MTYFGEWLFACHIELKMAAILSQKPWSPKNNFFEFEHVVYHFVGNFMLIPNHIKIMGQECTGKSHDGLYWIICCIINMYWIHLASIILIYFIALQCIMLSLMISNWILIVT